MGIHRCSSHVPTAGRAIVPLGARPAGSSEEATPQPLTSIVGSLPPPTIQANVLAGACRRRRRRCSRAQRGQPLPSLPGVGHRCHSWPQAAHNHARAGATRRLPVAGSRPAWRVARHSARRSRRAASGWRWRGLAFSARSLRAAGVGDAVVRAGSRDSPIVACEPRSSPAIRVRRRCSATTRARARPCPVRSGGDQRCALHATRPGGRGWCLRTTCVFGESRGALPAARAAAGSPLSRPGVPNAWRAAS